MATSRGVRPHRIRRVVILSEYAIACARGHLATLLREQGIDPTQPYSDMPVAGQAARCFIQWQQDEPLILPEEAQDG